MSQRSTKAILANALKRRAELGLELKALDEVIRVCREHLRAGEANRDPRPEQLELYRRGASRSAHAAYIAELLEATRRILIAEGRPLKRGELIKRLEAQGYGIMGSDKNRVFGTNLWRSGKFVTVRGLGYWPADLNIIKETDRDIEREL